jgi:hypothetical protein
MNNSVSASYEYARTTITAEDITDGEEEGSLLFEVSRAGTLETALKMSAAEIVLNEAGADRDLRVEAVGQINALFVQGSDGNVGINQASPLQQFDCNGVALFRDKVAFTQTDLNEYIDSLNDGYMDYGATTAHRFNNDIVLPKTSGKGIKVDTTTPTFGWRDLLAEPKGVNTGASKPTWATYRDTLKQYQFAAADEEYYEYHITHDHVPDTDIHLHVHWSHTGTFVTGGTVTFEYEISYAKGHNQAAFGASVGTTFNGTASTTQYQHIVSEAQISAATPNANQIDSNDLEPDGVIIARVKVTSNDITVSEGAVPDPFIHHIDIHYQSTNIATKAKAPDFYA